MKIRTRHHLLLSSMLLIMIKVLPGCDPTVSGLMGSFEVPTGNASSTSTSDSTNSDIPQDPVIYPVEVETSTVTIPSSGWQTSMDLLIYKPKANLLNLPVIIFCAGSNGTNDTFPETSTYIASYGYVVVHNSWVGNAEHVEKTKNRAKDIRITLDALAGMGYSTLRVGIMGHSSGSDIAQIAGGALVEGESFQDDRVAAVLMYSGSGSGEYGLTPDSWSNFTVPMIEFTGANDFGALGQDATYRREPYDASPGGNKHFVWYTEGHHGSYSGKFISDPQQKEIYDHSQFMSVQFFNAYLKNDVAAMTYLRSSAPSSYNGALLTYEYR